MVVIEIACVARTRGLCPGMIVGGMVEHEIRAQADAGLAQPRGECDKVVVVAQARFDLAVIADRKAAIVIACARTQERQQVQIAHAQFLQIRHTLGHALQGAGEAIHIRAVAQHVLFAKPAGLTCCVQLLQWLRALLRSVAERAQPLRQPRRIVRALPIQRLQRVEQTRRMLIEARQQRIRTLRIQRRSKGCAHYSEIDGGGAHWQAPVRSRRGVLRSRSAS